jgi:signal-transduction protein with cAMP-binding, CBS, and nucleotidyltransferase domain
MKKTENIYQHFESYIRLSEELKSKLSNRLKLRSFKKGELVLDANRICKESYFIQNGIL